MGKNPTVSIIGGTIWGNRGAESMLTTVIGMIREDYPQARFNIFSYYPKTDRALIEDEAITVLSGKPASLVTRHFFGALVGAFLKLFKIKIPGSSFFKIARALDASDVLIDVGGITFSDGREKFLPIQHSDDLAGDDAGCAGCESSPRPWAHSSIGSIACRRSFFSHAAASFLHAGNAQQSI